MFEYENYRISISKNIDNIYIEVYNISNFILYSKKINSFVLNEEIKYIPTLDDLYKTLNDYFKKLNEDIELNIFKNESFLELKFIINLPLFNIKFNIILNKDKDTDKDKDNKSKDIAIIQNNLFELQKKYDKLLAKYNKNKNKDYYIDIFYNTHNPSYGTMQLFFKSIKISPLDTSILLSTNDTLNFIDPSINLTLFKIINLGSCIYNTGSPTNTIYQPVGFNFKHKINHLILSNINWNPISIYKINKLEIYNNTNKSFFINNIEINELIIRNELNNVMETLKTNTLIINKSITLYDCPLLKSNLELHSYCKTNKIKLIQL